VLLLAGERDEYCPAEELRAYGDGVAEIVVLDGTDHYLWRREREAAAIVGGFTDRVLFP
jgi:pimeloyl-ACP methyl ester carboxylesterase